MNPRTTGNNIANDIFTNMLRVHNPSTKNKENPKASLPDLVLRKTLLSSWYSSFCFSICFLLDGFRLVLK
jgi:hypothetical protein